MLDRRHFLTTASAGLLTALTRSRAAFASAPTENRLVVIFLRGGLDGLHALAPFADSDYRRLRPMLAVEDAHNLDGYFGLHPALAPLMPLYQNAELLLFPAAATQYRNRSHFDGQNMLENGSGRPYGANDGWLNRAILGLNEGNRRLGLALGPSVPLILQGDAEIQTWATSGLPEVSEDFLMRLSFMYQNDRLFAEALHDASGALKPDLDMSGMSRRPLGKLDFNVSAQAAADLLARADGPRIGVMELQGWDTHFNQNQRLNALLGDLADGILTLKSGLGNLWERTAIMVVSEFGRTVAENGSLGTDHGTGGLAMLAGGGVTGGRIAGDWPGLNRAALWEDRDLRPVNAYESLFKSVLIGHLGLDQGFVEDRVFPASARLAPQDGLFRSA